jgi:surfactin synthase thioesterase subunit
MQETTMTPTTVFCLPYAGGTARAYQRWRRQFPPELEVIPLEIAGRGVRVTEPSPGSIRELADDLSRQVCGHQPRPTAGYVLFGHSMGALTAFEMALTHSDHGLPAPALVVISGRNPPYLRSRWGTEVLDLSDRELLAMVAVLGRVPAGPLPSIAARLVPRLRADLRIALEYRLEAADATVDVPLLVLRGRADPLVDPDHVAGWERYTRRQCTVRHHNGGHFALFERNSGLDELIDAIRAGLILSAASGEGIAIGWAG